MGIGSDSRSRVLALRHKAFMSIIECTDRSAGGRHDGAREAMSDRPTDLPGGLPSLAAGDSEREACPRPGSKEYLAHARTDPCALLGWHGKHCFAHASKAGSPRLPRKNLVLENAFWGP